MLKSKRYTLPLSAGCTFPLNPITIQIAIHKSANFKGYTALLGENTDATGNGDLHEGFDLGYEPLGVSQTQAKASSGSMAGENVWPEGLAGFKEPVLEY